MGHSWGYYFYDDYDAALFTKTNMSPEIYDVYAKLPFPILRADLFRYCVIYTRGGLYADMDVEPLVSLRDWPELHRQDVGLIIGIEDDRRINPGAGTQLDFQLTQWTFAARPHHPALLMVIQRVLDLSTSKLNALGQDPTLTFDVGDWTGPAVFTRVIMDYLASQDSNHQDPYQLLLDIKHPVLIGDVLILPRKAFSNLGSESKDPVPRSKHFFNGSWKPFWFTRLWRHLFHTGS